jgi:hypothetical protein
MHAYASSALPQNATKATKDIHSRFIQICDFVNKITQGKTLVVDADESDDDVWTSQTVRVPYTTGNEIYVKRYCGTPTLATLKDIDGDFDAVDGNTSSLFYDMKYMLAHDFFPGKFCVFTKIYISTDPAIVFSSKHRPRVVIKPRRTANVENPLIEEFTKQIAFDYLIGPPDCITDVIYIKDAIVNGVHKDIPTNRPSVHFKLVNDNKASGQNLSEIVQAHLAKEDTGPTDYFVFGVLNLPPHSQHKYTDYVSGTIQMGPTSLTEATIGNMNPFLRMATVVSKLNEHNINQERSTASTSGDTSYKNYLQDLPFYVGQEFTGPAEGSLVEKATKVFVSTKRTTFSAPKSLGLAGF